MGDFITAYSLWKQICEEKKELDKEVAEYEKYIEACNEHSRRPPKDTKVLSVSASSVSRA